jgi:hypothetical protein
MAMNGDGRLRALFNDNRHKTDTAFAQALVDAFAPEDRDREL